jgi:hypothetical protein
VRDGNCEGEDGAVISTEQAESQPSSLLRRVLLVPLWAAVAIEVVILFAALPGRANKWDYSIYYSSALAMREGMNPYTTDLTPLARSLGFELDKINHATDPPTFVMCFVPLTLLAPRPGFYVWTAINAASFLLALILLFRWTPGLGRDPALALAAVILLFPPVIEHLAWGQNKMLVLLMFVLMLRWLERGSDVAAGLMLAVAALLRAFPLLLIAYLALMKRWRAVGYTILGLAVGGLLTLALAGVGSTMSFVLAPTYLTEQWREALPGNIALGPTIARMFWYFFGLHLGTTLGWAQKITTLGAELVLLGLTIKATVSRPADGDPDGRIFVLWMMTAILISPTSWFYYLVLLAIPMVRLSAAAANDRTSARALWAGVACYTLAWLYFSGVDMHSQELALHPNTLLWRVGASPVALTAYLSLYWFTTDSGAADRLMAESRASQAAHSIGEAQHARTAV